MTTSDIREFTTPCGQNLPIRTDQGTGPWVTPRQENRRSVLRQCVELARGGAPMLILSTDQCELINVGPAWEAGSVVLIEGMPYRRYYRAKGRTVITVPIVNDDLDDIDQEAA